jgi:hypothetical protein
MGAAFVYKNEALWVNLFYLLAPGGALLLVAL